MRLRRVATKALKSYGPGIPHLESVMQETMAEVIDLLQEKEGQPVDMHQLGNGYICCVIASIVSVCVCVCVCVYFHQSINNNIFHMYTALKLKKYDRIFNIAKHGSICVETQIFVNLCATMTGSTSSFNMLQQMGKNWKILNVLRLCHLYLWTNIFA